MNILVFLHVAHFETTMMNATLVIMGFFFYVIYMTRTTNCILFLCCKP
jgi:hypothetical protein